MEGVAREIVKLQVVGCRLGEKKVLWGGAAGWRPRKGHNKSPEPKEPQLWFLLDRENSTR